VHFAGSVSQEEKALLRELLEDTSASARPSNA
jgi:hypothetical protein